MKLRAVAVSLVGVALAVAMASPAAPAATRTGPRVTATPHNHLIDGQAITVSVSGLVPGTIYTIDECVAGAAAAGNAGDLGGVASRCSTGFVDVMTDANGSATATLTVYRAFTSLLAGSNPACGGRGRRCVVVAGRSGYSFVEKPIDFAGFVPCFCPPARPARVDGAASPFGIVRR